MSVKQTLAPYAMPCARCGETIEPGERMQRGAHWRCYMVVRRAGELATLPRAQAGRPRKAKKATATRTTEAAAMARAQPWRAPWTCVLCANAGQPTLAPRSGKKAICQDHADALRTSGRGWCSRGCHAVPLDDIRRGYICRLCDNARRAAAYWADPERERAQERARHAANPEPARRRSAAWKAAHPERHRAHVAAYMRRWRATHHERHLANNRRYRERNRARLNELSRIGRKRRLLRVLWGGR